jgi:predicted HTH transcriptional regulator
MTEIEFKSLLKEFEEYEGETEFFEFKINNTDPDYLGKAISALANGAALVGRPKAYIIFGLSNEGKIVGTEFKPNSAKKGNEQLVMWLTHRMEPRVDFMTHTLEVDGKRVSVIEIQAAPNRPVSFLHERYIRVGENIKLLKGYPEKERKIWHDRKKFEFESQIAKEGVLPREAIQILNTKSYYDLIQERPSIALDDVIDQLESAGFLIKEGAYVHVTNLGAILFANDLTTFPDLERKGVRLLTHPGADKTRTDQDIQGQRGYALGFDALMKEILVRIPQTEHIGSSFREIRYQYPVIAIRELVANALIHQDFTVSGAGPSIDIFNNRIEVASPGSPIIETQRFIDEYRSPNEKLAFMARKLKICEERGSGIDKVIDAVEKAQLPPPKFSVDSVRTIAVLFGPKKLSEMSKEDKVRACFQHCSIVHIRNEAMSNQSLRDRLGIEPHNYSIASRIINDTIQEGLIKPFDPENLSRKHARYIPFWA